MAGMLEEPVDLQEMESNLEDTLTNEKLKKLEELFASADEDGGGGLDMDEFRIAMRGTMGTHVSDKELDMIFMKVDTNCDGTVDWDEYLTFMLLECREKELMNVKAQQPFPRYSRNVHGPHRDSIIKILYTTNANQDTRHGRYASISIEGVFATWNMDMQLLSTHKIEPTNPNSKTMWVTDAVNMYDANLLAVATTNREIIIYDIYSTKFDQVSRINRLDECASCISYHVHAKSGMTTGYSTLLWGDCSGGVSCIVFNTRPQRTAIRPKRSIGITRRIPFSQILEGHLTDLTAYSLSGIHGDMVRAVTYISHLGCFISCSKDPTTALYLGDWERKITSSYFQIPRGTNTFLYSQHLNVIVTGGDDSCVRIWNPYVPSKPITVLKGHQSPVLHVTFNKKREHVATVGENKEIRIFDLNSQTCIQTFYRKMVTGLGPRHISAIFFNASRQALLLATTSISILEHRADDLKTNLLRSHSKGITKARYNKLFNQVVSVGLDSMVHVWNFDTGEKVMQFCAHKIRRHGESINVEITTMAFDHTLRRLITADRDGTVKVWNFNNGACLRTLPQFDRCEVTSIVCPKQKIVTGGWNKRPTVYVDRVDEDEASWLIPTHREDIVDLTFYPPYTLISASFDGDLVVWSLETGHLLSCLNPTRNSLPCSPAGYLHSGFVSADHSTQRRGNFPNIADVVFKVTRHRAPSIVNKTPQDMPTKELMSSEETETPGEVQQSPRRKVMRLKRSIFKDKGLTNYNNLEKEIGRGEHHEMNDPLLEYPPSISPEEKDQDPAKAVTFADVADIVWNKNIQDDSKGKGLPTPQFSSAEVVTCLIALQSREHNAQTATLLAAYGDGTVRAWSMHHNGGLLGKFKAVHKVKEYITAMSTDDNNYYLATGDSGGYIKVWYISGYCTTAALSNETKQTLECSHADFPFVWWTEQTSRVKKECWLHEYAEYDGPCLINSFLAHVTSVTTIDLALIEEEEYYIISGSSDCSVRLWTIRGKYVGIFGHKFVLPGSKTTACQTSQNKFVVPPGSKNSGQMDAVKQEKQDIIIPPDVRRVASATSLMVLNCGQRPGWRLVRNTFRWLNRFSLVTDNDIISQQEEAFQLHRELSKFSVKTAYETIGKSEILGKSYKRSTRHRPLPSLRTIRQCGDAFSPYASLPFNVLEEIVPPPTPEVVTEIQQRHERADAEEQKLVREKRVPNPVRKVAHLVNWRRSKRNSINVPSSSDPDQMNAEYLSETDKQSGLTHELSKAADSPQESAECSESAMLSPDEILPPDEVIQRKGSVLRTKRKPGFSSKQKLPAIPGTAPVPISVKQSLAEILDNTISLPSLSQDRESAQRRQKMTTKAMNAITEQ